MTITYAFDVYGTLIDPLAIGQKVEAMIGEDASAFAKIWREKQLEYTFRRGLMGAYKDFAAVTAEALDFTCLATGHDLSETEKSQLLEAYRTLEAFPDTALALKKLRGQGAKMYAFSNGTPDDLQSLLQHAGVLDLLDGVVSVDPVHSFKPDPAVYRHFCASAKSAESDTCLVSSNPFDILGAANVGWQTAWVRRSSNTIMDPWDMQPTKVITTLTELA
jgi:2-haloacid dehalogenase